MAEIKVPVSFERDIVVLTSVKILYFSTRRSYILLIILKFSAYLYICIYIYIYIYIFT